MDRTLDQLCSDFPEELLLVLAFLRASLNDEDSLPVESLTSGTLDWNKFLSWIDRHRLAPVIHAGVRDEKSSAIPEFVRSFLREHARKNGLRSLALLAENERVLKLFEENEINPGDIALEVTERSAINNLKEFEQLLGKLRQTGVKIAVDDAGAGYSSLNTIATLQPDYLKFDMALVRDIDKDKIKQDLLLTVKELSDKIGSAVIAEGIETKAEFDTIKGFGVKFGQGYYLSRPKPPDEIISHIQKSRTPS